MAIRNDNYVTNQRNAPAIVSDVFANRPTGFQGQIFISQDTFVIQQYLSGSWVTVAGYGSGSGVTWQQSLINGSLLSQNNTVDAQGFLFAIENLAALSRLVSEVNVSNESSGLYVDPAGSSLTYSLPNTFDENTVSVSANDVQMESTNGRAIVYGQTNVEITAVEKISLAGQALDIDSGAPTITAGAALDPGGGGSASLVNGNDITGRVQLIFGAAPPAAGQNIVISIAFSAALPAVPKIVLTSGAALVPNAATSTFLAIVNFDSITANGFDIVSTGNLASLAGATRQLEYLVII